MERKKQIFDMMEAAANQGLVDRNHTYAKHVFNLVYATFGDPRPKNEESKGNNRNRNRNSNLSNNANGRDRGGRNSNNTTPTKPDNRNRQRTSNLTANSRNSGAGRDGRKDEAVATKEKIEGKLFEEE